MDKGKNSCDVDKVQLVYAKILETVSSIGFVFLAMGYLVYVLQLLPLSVPIDAIAANWHLKASDMQQKLHTPLGWSFTSGAPASLAQGDIISYLSIFYLAMATIACLVFAAVTFYREKNYIYTTIVVLQVVVLVVAATGLIH